MKDVPSEVAQREEMPAFLRQFARRRPAAEAEERCELCSAPLAEAHQHLLDPKKRQIVCACDGCVILFCGQTGAHYLRVPRRIQRLVGFQMSELQWEALMLPINLAFFYRDSAAGRVLAMYPSPAGATESLLSLESWEEIVAQNRALQADGAGRRGAARQSHWASGRKVTGKPRPTSWFPSMRAIGWWD